MNPPPAFNPRRLIVTAVLALAAITAILLWAQGIVREVFVLPLSYLWYLIRILTITTPEWYFWAVLLVLLTVAGFRTLAGKRTVYYQPPLSEMAELGHSSAASGRVLYWAQKVQLMRRGASRYYMTNFHNTYGRLLVNVLSHRYRITPREVENRLHDGTLEVPQEIREYALFALERDAVQPVGFLPWLWRNIVERVREMFPSRQPDVTSTERDDPRVAAILRYIEDELEVSHDHTGR